MLTDIQKAEIRNIFQRCPETRGCMITLRSVCPWVDSATVYSGDRCTDNYNRRYVVIEEVFAEPAEARTDPNFISNRSMIRRELVGAGLSCGFFIVSVAGATAGAVAPPVMIVAWVGVATGGVQCLNGIIRASEAVGRPDENTLQVLDADPWYNKFILLVDMVGVIAGLAQLVMAGRNLFNAMMKQPTAVRLNLSADMLGRMSRTERAAMVRKLLSEVEQSPRGKEIVEAALQEAGVSSSVRNASHYGTLSAVKAGRIVNGMTTAQEAAYRASLIAIQTQVARALKESAKDNWSTPFSLATNAMPSALVGSASGIVNYLIHCIDDPESN